MCARTINWESYFRFVTELNNQLGGETTTTTVDEGEKETEVKKLTREVVVRMKRLESIYLRQHANEETGDQKVPVVRLQRLTEEVIQRYKVSSDGHKCHTSKGRGIKVNVRFNKLEKIEGLVMNDRRRSNRKIVSYGEIEAKESATTQ